MRPPRVQFTIRWVMVAVARAATILGAAVELQRRHDRFLRLAEHHEASSSITYACGNRPSRTNGLGEDVRRWPNGRIEWHRRLGEKYRRAASRPWLPVDPDPPQP
jgi:hypothetical protein